MTHTHAQSAHPIPILRASDPGFDTRFAVLRRRALGTDTDVQILERTVRSILTKIRTDGDPALVQFTRQFDARPDMQMEDLEVPRGALEAALRELPTNVRSALQRAHDRILRFHAAQRADLVDTALEEDGIVARLVARPLERVGVYVPGGRAAYPSTVLMNTVPARAAGVSKVIMVTPAQGGQIAPVVLAAAQLAGVDRVFAVGGAQAIGALAYGTTTIPRVDKIVGPGNAFVTEAKRQVFGLVDIDQIAGPSEVLIVADQTAKPKVVAADLLAQAEHDPRSAAIAITWDEALAEAIRAEVSAQLEELPRQKIARDSLFRQGAIVVARDLEAALELANEYAPEHLGLAIADADRYVDAIRNAGAIFVGHLTAEALGDYNAGVNHVLPTSGSARFASPLSVHEFIKRMTVLRVDASGHAALARDAALLARAEGLEAHARAVEIRQGDEER